MAIKEFGKVVTQQKLIQMIRQLAAQERLKLQKIAKKSLQEIAHYYNLELHSAPLEKDKDGALLEKKIILNSKVTSLQRRNFTFYHEITHYLINTNDDLLSQIHEAIVSPDVLIERLCNAGAAEFLIPSDSVQSYVQQHGFQTKAIQVLAQQFGASYLATSIQFIVCASHECYLVVAEESPDGKLYVSFGASSFSAKYKIARSTVIPTPHIIHTVYTQRKWMKGHDTIPFRSKKEWVLDCDATYLGGSVYTFFNATPPIDPSQLSLFN